MNYCLIIPDFRGIGGAQLYAFRRYKYLMQKGYHVFFVVGQMDNILFKGEYQQIPLFVRPEILSYVFDTIKDLRNEVANCFIDFFNGESSSVIETFDDHGATWGELFAKKINCKHIVYSLIEPVIHKNIQDRPILKFFNYKLERGEFIGLSSVSLEKIFERKFYKDENRFVNIAYDVNELAKITKPNINNIIDRNAFVISTVSRLEKSYINHLITNVILLARKFPKKDISLIIGGDSEVGNYKKIFKKKYLDDLQEVTNLKIFFTGYLHPLGVDFFKLSDVFVGMGTAAVSSISQGCATIVVDPFTNLSSGVFGIDTNNFAYSESGIQWSIFESLQGLLINAERLNKAKCSGQKLFQKEFSLETCMERLNKYIEISCDDHKYWNFNRMDIVSKFVRLLYRKKNVKGILALNRIRHYFKSILNKYKT